MKLRKWLLANLNGLLAILFGIGALFFPADAMAMLAVVFSVFVILGGTALIISAVRNRKTLYTWTYLLIEGILGLVIGFFILSNPSIAATLFVVLVGVWGIAIALLTLFTYFRMKEHDSNASILIVSSILFLTLSILIAFNPFHSAKVITFLIGAFALLYGLYGITSEPKPGFGDV